MTVRLRFVKAWRNMQEFEKTLCKYAIGEPFR